MNRRALLGALATGLASTAGCTAGDGGTPEPTADREPTSVETVTSTTVAPTTTPTTTETTREPTEPSVRVSEVEVTPSYVALTSPDSIGVFGDRGEQFVLATVTVAGSGNPPPDEFALETDGLTYRPSRRVGDWGGGRSIWNRSDPYHGDERQSGWFAFAVPKPLDTEAASITWPGGELALDEDAVAELGRPPTDWELREFTAPETVTPGGEATLSLSVANVGDADGTFVAALNREGPSVARIPETVVSLAVPAGDEATWEYGYAVDRPSGEEERMTFDLVWRGGHQSREVAIESE